MYNDGRTSLNNLFIATLAHEKLKTEKSKISIDR